MTERLTVVDAAGRRKAYRPLPLEARTAAIVEGIAAYERGDFFEAHELLEPAWMGTPEPDERALLQGLIKLAAAYVHEVRGNPAGMVKNLDGARARILEGRSASAVVGVDADALALEIDARLADLAAHADGPTLDPPPLPRRPR